MCNIKTKQCIANIAIHVLFLFFRGISVDAIKMIVENYNGEEVKF